MNIWMHKGWNGVANGFKRQGLCISEGTLSISSLY